MAESVLAFEDVALRRGRRPVLEAVSFAVAAGESWALIGRNGAGKSTLLLAALGTLRPHRGAVGRARGLEDRSEVGFVPQRCTLDPTLPTTVAEFVELGLVGLRLRRAERRARTAEALEAVELGAQTGRSFWQHSEGQRQRILLARALARRPRYLLMTSRPRRSTPRRARASGTWSRDCGPRPSSRSCARRTTSTRSTGSRATSRCACPARRRPRGGSRSTEPRTRATRSAPRRRPIPTGDRHVSDLWADFVSTWPLFGSSYLVGWLIALVLALCGVIVVAQRQVFLGVATAQASSLGIAVALWLAQTERLFDHHDLHGTPLVFGIAFAVLASLLTSRRLAHETADAVGAWVFVIASGLAVVLLAHSPHGLEEVERLMFSSLIGADEHDVWKFGGLALGVLLAFSFAHRPILLVATDPPTAAALGIPARSIATVLALVLGLSIGMAMHSAGTLYTFSCLALPALAAKHVCRTMRGLAIVAPLLGVVTALVGFVLANGYDYPPGQVAAVVQGAVLVGAWAVHAVRRA